jgi:alkanesulfonate monooxygenase SsuD/methylene tetrahydromethanopterin reductase-like flavin-dependent oxidoreductase (luciferase family)
LWSGEPVTFAGEHFQLDGARTTYTPASGNVPIVIGGSGERRTLRLVAEHADEWNITAIARDAYPAKVEVLERHCAAVGRDPASIRRSLMIGHIIGRDQTELRRRAANVQQVAVGLRDGSPDDALERTRSRGWLTGTPAEIVEEIQARGAQGIDRIMLQTFDMDDMEALELFASEVIPNVA